MGQQAPKLRRMGAARSLQPDPSSMVGVSTPERPRRASEVADPAKPTPSPLVSRRITRFPSGAAAPLPSKVSKAPPGRSCSPGLASPSRQPASPASAQPGATSKQQVLKRKLLMRKHSKQKPEEPKRAKQKPLRMTPLKRPASFSVLRTKRRKSTKVPLRKPATLVKVVESASPLRQRRPGTWIQELRGLDLKDVPISALSTGAAEVKDSENSSVDRPKRCRFQVLNAWRNNRIVYERLEGSPAPSVVALRLNCSPRPLNVMPRSIDNDASAIPLPAPQVDLMPIMDVEPPPQQARAKPSEATGPAGQSKVALSATCLEVRSTFITLPPAALGRLPQRVALPTCRGRALRDQWIGAAKRRRVRQKDCASERICATLWRHS